MKVVIAMRCKGDCVCVDVDYLRDNIQEIARAVSRSQGWFRVITWRWPESGEDASALVKMAEEAKRGDFPLGDDGDNYDGFEGTWMLFRADVDLSREQRRTIPEDLCYEMGKPEWCGSGVGVVRPSRSMVERTDSRGCVTLHPAGSTIPSSYSTELPPDMCSEIFAKSNIGSCRRFYVSRAAPIREMCPWLTEYEASVLQSMFNGAMSDPSVATCVCSPADQSTCEMRGSVWRDYDRDASLDSCGSLVVIPRSPPISSSSAPPQPPQLQPQSQPPPSFPSFSPPSPCPSFPSFLAPPSLVW